MTFKKTHKEHVMRYREEASGAGGTRVVLCPYDKSHFIILRTKEPYENRYSLETYNARSNFNRLSETKYEDSRKGDDDIFYLSEETFKHLIQIDRYSSAPEEDVIHYIKSKFERYES